MRILMRTLIGTLMRRILIGNLPWALARTLKVKRTLIPALIPTLNRTLIRTLNQTLILDAEL